MQFYHIFMTYIFSKEILLDLYWEVGFYEEIALNIETMDLY